MVEAVFTGQPKSITDERGTWTSSIFRDRAAGPVQVTRHGLAGDKVAQPYHGGPGAAICVHLNDHYSFWNSEYNKPDVSAKMSPLVMLLKIRFA
jgi:MOSC domain-containing protein YiiM